MSDQTRRGSTQVCDRCGCRVNVCKILFKLDKRARAFGKDVGRARRLAAGDSRLCTACTKELTEAFKIMLYQFLHQG